MNTNNNNNYNKEGHNLAMMLEEADALAFSAFTKAFDYVQWNYQSTSDKGEYEKVDQQLTGETKNKRMTYDVEVKMRDYAGNPADCVMEVEKKVSLDTYSDNERKIYMVFYPLINKVFIWNLNEFNQQELDDVYNPKFYCLIKTMYGYTMGYKEVYMLPTSKAKQYKFVSLDFFKESLELLAEIKKQKQNKTLN